MVTSSNIIRTDKCYFKIINFINPTREGQSKPPNLVRYCEPTGNNILVAGSDSSLHIMNTVTETFNKNLGKASHNRKASKKKSKYHVYIHSFQLFTLIYFIIFLNIFLQQYQYQYFNL